MSGNRAAVLTQPGRGLDDGGVPSAAFAVFTLAVRCDPNAKGARPQVCYVAQVIDRRLGVAILELTVGRAHAAHRLERARHALGQSRDFSGALLSQKRFPSLAKRPCPDVVLVRL